MRGLANGGCAEEVGEVMTNDDWQDIIREWQDIIREMEADHAREIKTLTAERDELKRRLNEEFANMDATMKGWDKLCADSEREALEIESLTAERNQLAERIKHFETMEPHWAKGYSSDGIAAQVSFGALNQLWQLLGVNDQTQAVKRIGEMLKGAN